MKQLPYSESWRYTMGIGRSKGKPITIRILRVETVTIVEKEDSSETTESEKEEQN